MTERKVGMNPALGAPYRTQRKPYAKRATVVQDEPQVDMGVCRERRIENLGKGLAMATKDDNYGKKKYFQREIEIQKAYQLIERAQQRQGTTGGTLERALNEISNPSGYN